jgi:hypothetical protein
MAVEIGGEGMERIAVLHVGRVASTEVVEIRRL